MRFLLSALAVTLLLILPACDGVQQAATQEVEKQVMAIHDELMPKMGYLTGLRQSIGHLRDSLVATKNETLKADAALADSCLRQLDGIENQMNSWMEKYDSDFAKNLDATGAMAYIGGQLTQVMELKTQLAATLLSTEQLLGRYHVALPKSAEPKAADHAGHGH